MRHKCGFPKLSHTRYNVSLYLHVPLSPSFPLFLSPSSSLPQAHCHYAELNTFQSALQTAEVNDSDLAILHALCSLYAVFGIVQWSGEFTMVTNLTDTSSLYINVQRCHQRLINVIM